MKFRTVTPVAYTPCISHSKRLLLLGSCFSENIGNKLQAYRFQTVINPFGVIYNPFSIAQSLERLIENRPFSAEELFEADGLWHSWAHHGAFSHREQSRTLQQINARYGEAAKWLPYVDGLILTFGSSWVYYYQDYPVANCHKLPADEFTLRQITVEEIIDRYVPLLTDLQKRNKDLRVILSVSPVRYPATAYRSNSTNKAILLLAAEALSRQLDFVHYFPAYEILIDDLRDYRFYADDLLHPSVLGVECIWQRFTEAYLDMPTRRLLPRILKINNALAHRPLHNDTESYQRFVRQTDAQVAQLEAELKSCVAKALPENDTVPRESLTNNH
ncbi:MAG: GSCFA domain-containing protein [Prevotellaceae bacterium]|jgi:lysophospholipase L1-like esterase|nr:GSCFA domain-containing protein [Prevotellaceae bacterium]